MSVAPAGMRGARASGATLAAGMAATALAALAIAASAAQADAPAIVASGRAGTLTLTLLAEPTPLRVGTARLTVVAQAADGRGEIAIDGARLHLEPPPDAPDAAPIDVDAALAGGVHAATVNLTAAGEWRAGVSVAAGGERRELEARLRVEPPLAPLAAWWPYLAAPFAFLALYAAHQALAQRRGRRAAPRRAAR